jgi:hypothetical protein
MPLWDTSRWIWEIPVKTQDCALDTGLRRRERMQTTLTWLLAGIAALMLHAGTAAAAKGSDTQVPEACQQPNLSPEVQRFCDQLQFAGEPHYHVVRLADNGAVRSIRLIETATGREVFTSYPHGIKFAAPDQGDDELRIRTEELAGALEGRPTPAGPVAARQTTPTGPVAARQTTPAPMGFASGLPIGWNPSTGQTPGQCLNYTIAPLSGIAGGESFSSQNTASSTAEQINVSASVSVAFDFLQVSDTASFSDQWQSSTNSSNQYFNLYSLYTLNSTVSGDNPLTAQGQNAGTSFNTLCGSEYLASVPVGMVVTLSINYGSTSLSTLMSISNTFSVNAGLDSVSTAVQTASADTSSASYFTFSMVHYGGGAAAAAALHTAFAAENAAGEAFYALCAQGNAEACTQFTSSLGQGAGQALNSVNTRVEGLSGATNPDLSFLEAFPHGVAGASTPERVTTDIPVPTSEVLAPYRAQLEQSVTLVNQIATLNNRVNLLQGLLNQEPAFNPAVVLDLVSYLDRLEETYRADRNTLLISLENCLMATSANVTSACQPIINNQATNAFDYYGMAGNFFAQQNTLALQYTGVVSVPDFPMMPLDVLYIDELPPFAAVRPNVPIAGEAAFVSFIDRPLGFTPSPQVNILALEPNTPLSTDNVSMTVRDNPPAPSPFTLWQIVSVPPIEPLPTSGLVFTALACSPRFANLCAINYAFSGPDVTISYTHRPILELFTAD